MKYAWCPILSVFFFFASLLLQMVPLSEFRVDGSTCNCVRLDLDILWHFNYLVQAVNFLKLMLFVSNFRFLVWQICIGVTSLMRQKRSLPVCTSSLIRKSIHQWHIILFGTFLSVSAKSTGECRVLFSAVKNMPTDQGRGQGRGAAVPLTHFVTIQTATNRREKE